MTVKRRGPWLVSAIVLAALGVAGFGWWWHLYGPGARLRQIAQDRAAQDGATRDGATHDGAEVDQDSGVPLARFQPAAPEPTSIAPNEDEFVGVAACVECHAERVAQFVTSDHFRTSRLADPQELADRVARYADTMATTNPNLSFVIRQLGEQVVQEAIVTGSASEQRSEPMQVVIGAGNYDEDYFFWRGERLFQAPLVWMHPRRIWCNASGYVDGTADFDRQVLPRCLECHTTYAQPIAGSTNGYHRESIGWGIGCERCHGPGQRHVQHHLSAPDDPTARAIGMPSELSRERSLGLCNQCHGNATVRRTAPFSFRPGDDVETHYRSEISNRAEEDHTSNQIQYLREAACFVNSPTMTCITCHDPHVGRESQRAGSFASCAACHQPEACGARSRLPEPVRDRCVDCHMPPRPVANITFDLAEDHYAPLIERYDHRIAVHQDATWELELEWAQTQSEPQWQARSAELRRSLIELRAAEAERMASAGREAAEALALRELIELDPTGGWQERLQLSQDRRRRIDRTMHDALVAIDRRRFPEAIELLEQVVAERPDFALAHGKLGMILYETGRREEGMAALERVNEIDPDDGYGLALLGYIALLQQDWEAAEKHYLAAAALEPYSAKIEFYLGTVRTELGRYDEAYGHLTKALAIEPARRDAKLALAVVHSKRGEHEQAIALARELADATFRRDPTVLIRLAQTYAAAERFGEAASALSQAAGLVPPEQRAELQQQVQQWRDRETPE